MRIYEREISDMFCHICGSKLIEGSVFCSKCGQSTTKPAAADRRAQRPIIENELSMGRTFARSIPLIVFFGASGVGFAVFGFMISESAAVRMGGYANWQFAYYGSKALLFVLAALFLLLAFLIPVIITSKYKNHVLCVYEDGISGTAWHIVPPGYINAASFDMPYADIASVRGSGAFVKFYTRDNRMFKCRAFNAGDIAAAINARLYAGR